MSVRFFKIFSGVFLAHFVLLNVVWVGFSAPGPRPPATFVYEGAQPARDTGNQAQDVRQKGKTSDQFDFDHHEASYFNHWIEMRDPGKPITNY